MTYRKLIIPAFLRQVESFRGILFLATNRSENDFDAAVLGRVDIKFYYDCSSTQRKIRMWKKQLLTSLQPEEADSIAEIMGEKYAEVDYRIISKLIKLAQLLAASKGTSFGLLTLEEAMVLHSGRLLKQNVESSEEEAP
jgi:hypothetical protein